APSAEPASHPASPAAVHTAAAVGSLSPTDSHAAAASRPASAQSAPASPTAGRPAPESALRPAAAPVDDACKDVTDVTCLVNGYEGKCCEVSRQAAAGHAAPPRPASPDSASGSGLPEKLDRQSVAAGLAGIDTSECRGKAHGDVALSVK